MPSRMNGRAADEEGRFGVPMSTPREGGASWANIRYCLWAMEQYTNSGQEWASLSPLGIGAGRSGWLFKQPKKSAKWDWKTPVPRERHDGPCE